MCVLKYGVYATPEGIRHIGKLNYFRQLSHKVLSFRYLISQKNMRIIMNINYWIKSFMFTYLNIDI
jgi:hypothetical protein